MIAQAKARIDAFRAARMQPNKRAAAPATYSRSVQGRSAPAGARASLLISAPLLLAALLLLPAAAQASTPALTLQPVEEATGPEAEFTIEEAGEAARECPNEGLREESNLDPATERPYSTELPDCRAWELVTATNKNLSFPQSPFFVPGGERLFSEAVGGFAGGSSGGSLFNFYEFSRADSGWQTTPLYPAPSEYTATEFHGWAATESGEALLLLRRPDAPGGLTGGENALYRRLGTEALVEVGPLVPVGAGSLIEPEIEGPQVWQLGSSADLNHIVFVPFTGGVWPGAEHSVRSTLYEYTGTGQSEPELVAVSNQGTVAEAAAAHSPPYQHINEAAEPLGACGSVLGMGEAEQGVSEPKRAENAHNAVSESGETVFFTVTACAEGPPVDELYARLGRSHTDSISEPPTQRGCSEPTCLEDATDPADFRNAGFQGASADGNIAIFLSPQRLLDSATQDPNPDNLFEGENCGQDTEGDSGCNLYAYDFQLPVNERLIDLSAGDSSGGGPQVQGVGAISEDGSHVYFVAKGDLTGGQENAYGAAAESGQDNLYVYDLETRQLSFIAVLSPQDRTQWRSTGTSGLEEGGPMQTTPDGHYLLFTSYADLTPDAEGEAQQIYRYDADSNRLVRVSIAEGGINGDGNNGEPAFMPTPIFAGNSLPGHDPSPAISNGGTVVFESRGALAPGAVQGDRNVYEYESGHVYLLTSAVPPNRADPIGIDHSGADAFIIDGDPLLPADGDSSKDVYDARTGGGFPAPIVVPGCDSGAACRAGQVSAPAPGVPSTSVFSGPEEGRNHPPKHRRHRRHHRHRRKKNTGSGTHRSTGSGRQG